MEFISQPKTKQLIRNYKPALAMLVLCLFLSSCGGMSTKSGTKDKKPKDEPAQAAKAGDATEEALPLERIPNPYLNHKRSVPSRAKDEFAKAHAALKAKKYKQAAGMFTLMTETYPKLSGPYVNLGIASKRMNNYTEAENAFKFAIQTNKYNMDAYSQLGVIYRELGQFSDAEKIYLQALDVWPHHLDSLLNIGILYDLYMGKRTEALRYFKLAQRVALKPDRKVKGWIVDLERRLAAENR